MYPFSSEFVPVASITSKDVSKIYSIYKIGTNSFGLIPLYIFLYLCILEIFPFVLVAKGFFY